MKAWESNIRKVEPYVPGEQPKVQDVIKLNTNENPYGPSENVRKAMEAIDIDRCRLYPDPDVTKLVGSIADYYGDEWTLEFDEFKKIKEQYQKIKDEYYSKRAYFDCTHENFNNVLHFNRTSEKERENTGGHATPKPIALVALMLKSSTLPDDTVLDVFGGSGSTLIACEQLGRTCYMNELDPRYVDVIIRRWEILTGEKALKIN